MKHPIRRRLMYLSFQGLRWTAQALPLSATRALGRMLGGAAYGCLRSQRRLTLAHLRSALGQDLSRAALRRIAHGVFRNLGQTFMEWLALPALSTEQLQRLIRAEGLEHVRRALAQGNGAVVITPHFGNWEMIPLYLRTLGFEGAVLARRLRYPEYESYLIGMRGARGVPTLSRGSLKEVARLLRANQLVGMLPDQDMDSLDGAFVDFFGRPAHTSVGPAALAMMTGSPLLPCFLIREGAGFRLVVEPPVPIPRAADRAAALAQATQAWSRVMESYIRRHPDQWVWMHRRWKTQPPMQSVQGSPEPTTEQSPQPSDWKPALSLLLLSAYCLVLTTGCGKPKAGLQQAATEAEAIPDPNADQRMSGFTLTGYGESGAKRWELNGLGASVDGQILTLHRPDGIGYEPGRTAYLTASAAQVRQTDRHVRLEHDVTIHTSDGVWFSTPVLHWIPDQNQVATDLPVRMETDHMLLRGRELRGLADLKHTTIFHDIELVLNPTDHDLMPGADALAGPSGGAPGAGPHTNPIGVGAGKQVTITCDGPLSFDYERNIATFERNVHVQDPNGDLYSDQLITYLDPASHTIRYAEAIGRVRIYQHQNTALSERAVYEPAVGKITLVGRPSLLLYPSSESGGAGGEPLSFSGLRPAKEPVPAPSRTQ